MRREFVGRTASLLALALGFQAPGARAEFEVRDTLFHFRTGLFKGRYASKTGSTDVSIATSTDMEFEKLVESRHSYYVHVLFAYNVTSNQMPYMGVGIGSRFYLGSNGMVFDGQDGGTAVSAIPTWRFYAGPEMGLSEAIVGEHSAALPFYSTLIEFGGAGGAIYQIGQRLGLELQTSVFYGYGFSTVSASSLSYRVLGGVSYYF